MLQRHIEIRDYLFAARHYLNQVIGNIAGKGIHDPNPIDAGCNSSNTGKKLSQTVFQSEVTPVIGRILSNQNDLSHAELL